MKKLILLGLSLIILGGCSSYTKKSGVEKRTGTLTTIGMSTWMYGTHVLSDDTGKPTTALSGEKSIDFNSYEGQKVEVIGLLKKGYPVDGGPEYLEVESIKSVD